MRLLAILAVCVLSISCAAPRPKPRMTEVIASEYAPYEKAGTGVLVGQAFLKTRGGEVRYGAGNKVYLHPVTTFSTEWYTRQAVGGELLEPTQDPIAARNNRVTTADGNGNFRFEGLPAGEYYVVCPIVWEAVGHLGYLEPTGGYAHAQVKVSDGKETRAIVTGQ
jgi:hypothetical protein